MCTIHGRYGKAYAARGQYMITATPTMQNTLPAEVSATLDAPYRGRLSGYVWFVLRQ